MNAIEQHMIDAYRSAQHGEPAPPLPGAHDWSALTSVRDYHRFTAVVAGRPAGGRTGPALTRLVSRLSALSHSLPLPRGSHRPPSARGCR